MGQCTSCSTQRPNLSSSVPQTPEFELSPNNNLFSASIPATQPTSLKLKAKLKKSNSRHLTSVSSAATRKKELPDSDETGNSFMNSVGLVGTHQSKLSKKHRVSPQTSLSRPKTVSFALKDSRNETHEDNSIQLATVDKASTKSNSKSSGKVSLRKLLQIQARQIPQSATSKLQASACSSTRENWESNTKRLETTDVHDGNQSSEKGQILCLASPSARTNQGKNDCIHQIKSTNSSPEPITASADNNGLLGIGIGGTNNLLLGLKTADTADQNTTHIPISSFTLRDLNSSRQEKKFLRDLFLFGTTNITSPRTNSPALYSIGTGSEYPTQSVDTDMSARCKPSPIGHRGNPGQTNSHQNVPEKQRRTFKYQPPSSSTSPRTSHTGALVSPAGTTNTVNVNLAPEIYFTPPQNDSNIVNNNVRNLGNDQTTEPCCYLPKNTRTSNKNIGGSGTYYNNTPPSSKSSVSLRKVEQPKPFYTILYPSRAPPTTPSYSKINTGLVNQRKLFYQTKFTDENSLKERSMETSSSPTAATDILVSRSSSRSTTLVKETISSSAKKTGPTGEKVLIRTQSIADNASSHPKALPKKEPFKIRRSENQLKSNFPLQRDTSSSSSMAEADTLHGAGDGNRHGHHHQVSDSEYLDDEISDQPDLTLTFKELSSSSSGESLLSDQMLDTTKNENRFARGDIEASDSAFSDVSSTNPPSLTHAKSSDGITSPKTRVRTGPLISSTPTLAKSKELKPNFILRNIRQTNSSSGNAKATTGRSNTESSPRFESHSGSSFTKSSQQRTRTSPSKLRQSPEKIELGMKKEKLSYTDQELEEYKESVLMEELIGDISCLKSQLEMLKVELEGKQKIETEKDVIIEKLMHEIDILKRSASGNTGRSSAMNGMEPGHATFPRSNLRLNCEPSRANAAAQTDSDVISPVRGLSVDDYDKSGELVSFRIGRRVSASSTPTTSNISPFD